MDQRKIDAYVAARERGYICVSNVHAVMAAAEYPQLRAALLSSSLNVPDGQPLVWAMNALGTSLEARVYGPELMWRACEHAARTGQRFYLYGGRNQGALVQLALNLRQPCLLSLLDLVFRSTLCVAFKEFAIDVEEGFAVREG